MNKTKAIAAVVTSNPMGSIIEYECPCGECGWTLESDGGFRTCTMCGDLVECTIEAADFAGTIEYE